MMIALLRQVGHQDKTKPNTQPELQMDTKLIDMTRPLTHHSFLFESHKLQNIKHKGLSQKHALLRFHTSFLELYESKTTCRLSII